ncbi:hypothetical protein quinque_002362 [Culex quinquefasciatus]
MLERNHALVRSTGELLQGYQITWIDKDNVPYTANQTVDAQRFHFPNVCAEKGQLLLEAPEWAYRSMEFRQRKILKAQEEAERGGTVAAGNPAATVDLEPMPGPITGPVRFYPRPDPVQIPSGSGRGTVQADSETFLGWLLDFVSARGRECGSAEAVNRFSPYKVRYIREDIYMVDGGWLASPWMMDSIIPVPTVVMGPWAPTMGQMAHVLPQWTPQALWPQPPQAMWPYQQVPLPGPVAPYQPPEPFADARMAKMPPPQQQAAPVQYRSMPAPRVSQPKNRRRRKNNISHRCSTEPCRHKCQPKDRRRSNNFSHWYNSRQHRCNTGPCQPHEYQPKNRRRRKNNISHRCSTEPCRHKCQPQRPLPQEHPVPVQAQEYLQQQQPAPGSATNHAGIAPSSTVPRTAAPRSTGSHTCTSTSDNTAPCHRCSALRLRSRMATPNGRCHHRVGSAMTVNSRVNNFSNNTSNNHASNNLRHVRNNSKINSQNRYNPKNRSRHNPNLSNSKPINSQSRYIPKSRSRRNPNLSNSNTINSQSRYSHKNRSRRNPNLSNSRITNSICHNLINNNLQLLEHKHN